MTSERRRLQAHQAGRPLQGLGTLSRILGQVGKEPPTGRELAELFWLARHMGGHDPGEKATAVEAVDPGAVRSDERTARAPATPPLRKEPAPEEPRPAAPQPAVQPPPRVPLRSPSPPGRPPAPADRHVPLLAPSPPMLTSPLDLQRSLRPLRRLVPSTAGWELDEAATADRIATLGRGYWVPVLRPRQERWLHLRIVYDAGPTMTMWRPLVRELHTLLAQTGAFRTLDVLRLGPEGRLPLRHRERGRTAVLIVSDAMGPQWREGPAGQRWRAALARLGAEMPVALLQPLPERLWRHTAMPVEPGRFVASAAGAPNAALDFIPYDGGGRAPTGVLLPVLEPSHDWLGHWAALVSSPSGADVPGAAAFLAPGPAAPLKDALIPAVADPEELVTRFHAVASPQAFRLAAHLAAGSAHLPVMRLIQAAVEKRPAPQHLAEVVLSGMLRAVPGAGPGAYDFRPGVRELLLTALPRTSLIATARFLARISAEIDARAGALPGEFRALVESLEGQSGNRAVGSPFALVSEESLRLLRGPEQQLPTGETAGAAPTHSTPAVEDDGADVWSGLIAERYRTLGRRPDPSGEHLLLAEDEVMDRRVLLRIHPYPAPAGFLARVDRQRNKTHHHLVQVLSGLELDGRCAVVMAALPGTTLRDLLFGHPEGLDTVLATKWAAALCSAVITLHDAGIVHGRIRSDRILLSDEGEPLLTDAVPYLGRHRLEDDLYDLGRLLYELATGRPLQDGTSPLSPREVRQDVSLTLEQAVLGLLSVGDGHRQEAARHMADLHAAGFRNSRTSTVRLRPNYRVFGPVKAWFDVLPETDALILARLLLARGDWIPADDLRRTPPDPLTERDLRHRLALLTAKGHPIDESVAGARIIPTGGRFDLAHVEKLLSEAKAAGRNGDRPVSARLHRAAEILLKDEPLAGLPGSWAEAERRQLLALHGSRRKPPGGEDPGLGGSRLRLLPSGTGDAPDADDFAAHLNATRTAPGWLVTRLDPVQAAGRVIRVAEGHWTLRRGGTPATLRIVLAGEETDEWVLDVIAAALPPALAEGRPRRRVLLAYPDWVQERSEVSLPTRKVPGHDRWSWVEVSSIPPPDPPPPGGRGRLLGRLFGRPSPRDSGVEGQG
ncbi:SAV_2336 N-terminal domain-related protein [Streptomyces rubiginosohelvolus]|uniref:SAV_2336 N-terminal domain-related protein n=1 Tax=Streptomyces rubiginosohelvolus TaxID=67362 RepID=UPI0036ABFF27